ncbi:FAD/NAD(P)-binding domain-containing protein [Xylariaceae sp. FL1272]|nr:FAD/NAD(P)-binding domain-containing protein [Xylariaceae sp. FL1272]
MAEQKSFEVIIAGGGIIGLTLANALERAGIDFILLEKRQIAPDLGASISLLCHNAKVYEQLEIVDLFNAATVPLLDRHHFDRDGHLFEDGGVLKGINIKTQRPFRFMERRFHLQTLFDNLRDKSKIRTQACVQSFVEDERGITVYTDNGEQFRGSLLVGADGAHSTVRRLMSQAVAATDPARAKDLISPFTASYRSIYATSRNINLVTQKPHMPDGTVHVAYYRGVSGVAATGVKGLIFWFLFVKEDVASSTPNCPRYIEADAESTIERFGHLTLGQGYTFRDLWNSRVKAAMFPMEEGVVKGPWNNGARVVLVGDSASKATVNPGLGGNTHVEGVCHLVNEMVALLKTCPSPRSDEITDMLNRYEEKQRPRAARIVALSGLLTRYEAMEAWWMRLLLPVMGWFPTGLISTLLAKYFAAGPLFEFLPQPDT